MLQPQSDEEIRPIIEQLRSTMDPLLDIRWEPQAVMTARGYYSELGKLTPPQYDGRWQVIRHETPSWRSEERREGTYVVICTLTESSREGGILHLIHGGAYAPVGEWVLELMRSADAQNVETFKKIRETLWAQHDEAEAARGRLDDGAAREALDHQAFEQNFAGGVGRFHGKGADFARGSTGSTTPAGLLIP